MPEDLTQYSGGSFEIRPLDGTDLASTGKSKEDAKERESEKEQSERQLGALSVWLVTLLTARQISRGGVRGGGGAWMGVEGCIEVGGRGVEGGVGWGGEWGVGVH